MSRKVALMEQQGTTAQPRRGAENENGSGAAPRRWLIQIEGDRVEQCCRVGVKGWEQNPTIQSFSCAAVCNQQKKNYGPREAAAHSDRLLVRPLTVAH
jgi:hypothetical protein